MVKNTSVPLATRYRQILATVHMVYRLVNSTYNVKELSLRLTRLLCQFVKAQWASIHILDPEKKKLVMIAVFNNQINILLEKKKELADVSEKESRVGQGYPILEDHFLGIPLVADEIVGAIFVRRKKGQPPFTDFDRDLLSIIAEQSVTAIKNLQLYDQQQRTILSSIKFIDRLLEKQGPQASTHTPAYFNILKCLAQKLNMGQRGIESLYHASILRNAGALDVPFEILSKNSQLTPDEFKIIRNLPTKSAALIRPVEFLKPVLPIILYHHENYDGTGYPSGLKKEQIPLGARIMAAVNAFEAMILGRPYKKKLSVEEALDELKKNSGTQFDPKVVKVFCELYKQKKFRNYLSRI